MIGNGQVWMDTPYGGKYISQEEYEMTKGGRLRFNLFESCPDGEIIKGEAFSTFDTEFRDTLNCKEEIQQILKRYPKNILKDVLLNILKELT